MSAGKTELNVGCKYCVDHLLYVPPSVTLKTLPFYSCTCRMHVLCVVVTISIISLNIIKRVNLDNEHGRCSLWVANVSFYAPVFIFSPLLSTTTVHFPSPFLLHSPTFYLATSIPLSEGRAGSI